VNEDLLNASFDVAINAYGAAGHAEAKDRLQHRFPHADFESITEAYLAACRLHDFAYGVADKNRDGVYSEADALAQLREQCPGFPERTYSKALSQGWFESR
jgi:hypothetical protein